MGLSLQLTKQVNGFTLSADWEIGNELAVLFGFSGAGKSMTLQMIAGLMRPDEGTIRTERKVFFDSEKDINLPPQKRSLGYVFQDAALFPHMTVGANIAYGSKGLSRSDTRSRVRHMVELFRLDGLEAKLPSEISGGQKQRVAFARALIQRPAALLLDEPFSALDAPLRLAMQDLLREIRREYPIPMVLITHDFSEAFSLADTIIVYNQGTIVQIGTPAEVTMMPATPDVELLVNTQGLRRRHGDPSGRHVVDSTHVLPQHNAAAGTPVVR